MSIQPSPRTAAAAGAWLALWAAPFEYWLDQQQGLSTMQSNLLFLAFALLFFLIPGYFLVLGSGDPFDSDWMLNSDERTRYAGLAKRMLAWFLSAGVVMAIWSVFIAFAGLMPTR